jgi:hypothetical protein
VPVYLFSLPLIDQRSDSVGPRARFRNKRIQEGWCHRRHDIYAFHRDAGLSGIGECSKSGLLCRPARIYSGVDDQRVVATVLHQSLGAAVGACPGYRPAGDTAAHVSHDVDVFCRGKSGTDCRIAVDDLRTPSGNVAPSSSANRRPVAGQRSLGLCTTVFSVTSAAPNSPAATATASFHGVSTATTPRGSGIMRSVAAQLP